MDHNFRREVKSIVREVYDDVKNGRLKGGMTTSAEGVATLALQRIHEKLFPAGTGLPNDPKNKTVSSTTILEIEKRVAVQYLEILLTDLKEKDPMHPKLWDR